MSRNLYKTVYVNFTNIEESFEFGEVEIATSHTCKYLNNRKRG